MTSGSRGAGEPGSRGAGGRGAGEPGSRGAGEQTHPGRPESPTGRASDEGQLEPHVGGDEAETLVEAVGILARRVGGELDPVAADRPGLLDGVAHEGSAHTGAPLVGVHVDGLDLGTAPSPGLDVAEHDQLADADDRTVELGHEKGAVARLYLAQGPAVGREVTGVLVERPATGRGTQGEQFDDPSQVGFGGRTDHQAGRGGVRAHPAIVAGRGSLNDRRGAPAR